MPSERNKNDPYGSRCLLHSEDHLIINLELGKEANFAECPRMLQSLIQEQGSYKRLHQISLYLFCQMQTLTDGKDWRERERKRGERREREKENGRREGERRKRKEGGRERERKGIEREKGKRREERRKREKKKGERKTETKTERGE